MEDGAKGALNVTLVIAGVGVAEANMTNGAVKTGTVNLGKRHKQPRKSQIHQPFICLGGATPKNQDANQETMECGVTANINAIRGNAWVIGARAILGPRVHIPIIAIMRE